MEFNYRFVGWLMIACLFFICCEFVVMDAYADENVSSVTIDFAPIVEVKPVVYPNSSVRISQGQCVEIGKYYDVSGIGWWTGYIGYYGRYTDDFSPVNRSLVTTIEYPYSIEKLKEYYIDPALYSQYPGYWYTMYPDMQERSANNRLFYVSTHCAPKETVINITPKYVNTTIIGLQGPLPAKYGDGIVLARGDPLFLTANETYNKMWLFGRDTGVYGKNMTDGIIIINSTDLINAESGMYKLDIQNSGYNKIFEASYNPEYKPRKYSNVTYPAIVSPFVAGNIVNIAGVQPMLVYENFKEYIRGTIDDRIIEYNIDFQDPQIYVARLDASILNDNRTFMQIRGYTNIQQKTQLVVTVDGYNTNSIAKTNNVFTTIVGNDTENAAEWRQFSIVIPIDYGNKFPGQHFLTVSSTTSNVYAEVPFYVRKELPAHYVPPQYIEFVDNSPFIPPVVVTKEVVHETVKEVIKEKIVKEEVDYVTLAKEELRQLLPIAIGGIVALMLLLYMVSVGIRTHERRKQKLVSEEKK